jgi:hypothetical protein
MEVIAQKLDDILASLQPLTVEWQDDTARRVIKSLKRMRVKKAYCTEDQDLDILAKSRGKSINKLVAGYLALMARRSRIHDTGGIFGSGKVSPRKARASEKSTRRKKTTTREV